MRIVSILAALTGLVATPSLACGPDADCVLGDRRYRIAMPKGYDGATPVGAIVFAHGHRGTAAGVMRNGSLRRMASDLGVALIAAQSGDQGWDIPNAPRNVGSDGIAEFAYFDAVLEDAAQRYLLDLNRVMATGFSAGGMMVWNLTCARSDRFAGFAPISGTFWLKPPDRCVGPVANVIHIHGDNDSTVPLQGRAIGPTKQGKVAEVLSIYGEFGGFGEGIRKQYDGLRCKERVNPTGDILTFCLFEGGHSFRTEYVRFAWEQLEKAGRL